MPRAETARPLFEITKKTSKDMSGTKTLAGDSVSWTEEEDKELFRLYKIIGSQWSIIAKEFNGKAPNQIKNRFYSTLRRVAIKKREQSGGNIPLHPQSKKFLLQYVDDAIEFGHNCASKRGRKKRRPVEVEQPPAEQPVEFKPFADLRPRPNPPESLSPALQPPTKTLPGPSVFNAYAPAQDSYTSTHSSGTGYSTDLSMQAFGKLQELIAAQKQLARGLTGLPFFPLQMPSQLGCYQGSFYRRPAESYRGAYNGFGGY